MPSIGERLKQVRTAKGLSQGDIERRSGLLRSYISRVEGGYTQPSLGTLEKFAKALDVEAYQFLFSGQGRATAPKLPQWPNVSQPARKLLKQFESMPSGDRRLFIGLASKLSRRRAPLP